MIDTNNWPTARLPLGTPTITITDGELECHTFTDGWEGVQPAGPPIRTAAWVARLRGLADQLERSIS